MIIQGFEIENWTCIRSAKVENLPESGIVVLHGPNGTGKSSIVAALRATLFDFLHDSKKEELTRHFQKQASEAARVSVSFRVGGASYRVTKQYRKSGACSLERQTPGGWSTVTKTPREVHEQTQQLLGSAKSTLGLQQLLWLTQGEYQLPGPKEFDANLQVRLRGVLGVMQTPLDDSFFTKVQKRWSEWFTSRSALGEAEKYKASSDVAQLRLQLAEAKKQLDELESRHRQDLAKIERADVLEANRRRMLREIEQQQRVVEELRAAERTASERIEACKSAEQRAKAAAAELERCRSDCAAQAAAARAAESAAAALAEAQRVAEQAGQQFATAERQRDELRARAIQLRGEANELQSQFDRAQRQATQDLRKSELVALRDRLQQAEEWSRELDALRQRDLAEPAPTQAQLALCERNRDQAAKIRADLAANSLQLTLAPEPGATGHLSIDSAETAIAELANHPVRRWLKLEIPGWGRLELHRGSDAREIAESESQLAALETAFRDAVAPLGFTGQETDLLARLRQRHAEGQLRADQRRRTQKDLEKLPEGNLDGLRSDIARRERATQIEADALSAAPPVGSVAECQRRAEDARSAAEAAERDSQAAIEALEAKTGPRAAAHRAETQCASAAATAKAADAALAKLAGPEQLQAALAAALADHAAAEQACAQAQLTEEERTLPERLSDAEASLRLRNQQLEINNADLHKLQGALSHSQGLHQQRAEAAADVERLERELDRATLEARAYDRLYRLFEECKDKQLSAVVAPVNERVLGWMRAVGIAGYRGLESGDDFLPTKLAAHEADRDLDFDQESTGTQEQLALMVRLALGSVIAPPGQPFATILDDPLTHSDTRRLDKMRQVLKRAAQGDPLAPIPASPLQILIFTCHPEWFGFEGGHTVDLGNPEVLQRG